MVDTGLRLWYSMSMKVGDTVKLTANPSVDWMHKYLNETFQVLDFLSETGVKLRMTGTDPEWIWIIGKANVEVTDENR